MSRFTVSRSATRIDVAFDDGGVNVLSSDALRELRGIVQPLIHPERVWSAGVLARGEPAPRAGSLESTAAGRPSTAGEDARTPRPSEPRLLTFRSSHASIFAAGADMAEMERFTPLQAAEFARLGQETFSTIERLPMITVALIDGDCFGGALDLVFSFDLRFATPRSRFSHPGGKLGIVTGFGGTSRWRKILAPSAARRMFLGNPVLSAEEGAAAGLVDRIGDDFEPECGRLESLDWAAAEFVKELTIHSTRLSRSDRLLVAERLGHIYFGPGTA